MGKRVIHLVRTHRGEGVKPMRTLPLLFCYIVVVIIIIIIIVIIIISSNISIVFMLSCCS